MTKEEKQKMMEEIMQVVEKHIAKVRTTLHQHLTAMAGNMAFPTRRWQNGKGNIGK